MSLYDSLKVYAKKRWQYLPLEFWAWLRWANPESLQKMWDTCPNGSWMLKALYDELYPTDALLPAALQKLVDVLLRVPTIDGRTLQTELINDWDEPTFFAAYDGRALPDVPTKGRPYQQLSWGILYQYHALSQTLVSWTRLYSLLGHLTDYYALTAPEQAPPFRARLADALRELVPAHPLPWFVDADFDVYLTIDYPTDVNRADYEPGADWWQSKVTPSDYRYLSREDAVWKRKRRISDFNALPKAFQFVRHMPQKPNGLRRAYRVEYSRILTFDEFVEFADHYNLLLNEHHRPDNLEPTWHRTGAWSIPSWDFVQKGDHNRRIYVLLDAYVDVYPQGDPPEGYTIEQCQAMDDAFSDFVEENWSLRS